MIVLKELAELVQACKNIKKRMHPRGHSIHVDDLAETIQKIIDDEFVRANRSYEERILDDMKEKDYTKPSTLRERNQRFDKRRKERSRRADRLNQSHKTDKGNA